MKLKLILQKGEMPNSSGKRYMYQILETSGYTNLLTIITDNYDKVIDSYDADGRTLNETFAKNIIDNLDSGVEFDKERLSEIIRITKIDIATDL